MAEFLYGIACGVLLSGFVMTVVFAVLMVAGRNSGSEWEDEDGQIYGG